MTRLEASAPERDSFGVRSILFGRWDVAWFLLWAIATSIWCITAATQLGATADEPPYVKMGLERWRTGSYQAFMAAGIMPLPADVQTLPLSLAEKWRGRPYDPTADLPMLLPQARAATLVFWWVLLGYGALIGYRLGGPWGGRLAVPFLACEPNLLAHACLATVDIALTACTVAFGYHFYTGRGQGWLRRVGRPMLLFALLLLSKASGVVYGGVCLLVIGLTWAAHRPPLVRSLRSLFLDAVLIVGGGFLLALLYVGSDWRVSEMLLHNSPGKLGEGYARRMLVAFGQLPIFSNLVEGILFQVLQNVGRTPAYMLGKVYDSGVWYFFPVVLSMKIPLTFPALAGLAAVFHPRALANWAILLALALLATSVTIRIQDGVRYVFPLIAFGVVGVAVAIAQARDTAVGLSRRFLTVVPALAVFWMTASAIFTWPDGIRYFNEIWRPVAPGYMLLNGSNYDWGQGLKALDKWHRQNNRPPLILWRFGNDPAFANMPVQDIVLESLEPRTAEHYAEVLRGHYLAASALNVYSYFDTPAVRFLRAHRPVTEVSTYLIYDFTGLPGAPK